jgi:molybdopterin/thiamine biosynthesis adenylyltransferase
MTNYKEFFKRNYGIFSEEEQEKIKNLRILIIGCGGIGATVAIMLARSGVSHFTLVEFDVYSPSNMNRQIGCFINTLGRNKADVIKEDILLINPDATVTIYEKRLSHREIADLITDVDMVFPAADDFAFSLFVFRDAKKLRKPALMVVPSGTWAHVSIIKPDSPSPEDIEGVPKLSTYKELRDTLAIRKYKFGTYFYVPIGDWRIDYYRAFIEEDLPPAQICPTVWFSSALGAFEVLKWATHKWKPVASPRYWNITKSRIRINRINGLSLHTLLVWQRKLMWQVFQTPLGSYQEKLQALWWNLYYSWIKRREHRRQSSQDSS